MSHTRGCLDTSTPRSYSRTSPTSGADRTSAAHDQVVTNRSCLYTGQVATDAHACQRQPQAYSLHRWSACTQANLHATTAAGKELQQTHRQATRAYSVEAHRRRLMTICKACNSLPATLEGCCDRAKVYIYGCTPCQVTAQKGNANMRGMFSRTLYVLPECSLRPTNCRAFRFR